MSYHDEMEELRAEREHEKADEEARPSTELERLVDFVRRNFGQQNRRDERAPGTRVRNDLFDK